MSNLLCAILFGSFCVLALIYIYVDAKTQERITLEENVAKEGLRFSRLINKYKKLANEAHSPLLPAVMELCKTHKHQVADYYRLERLSRKTVSKTKSAEYEMEQEKIKKQIASASALILDEIEMLEKNYSRQLKDDARQKIEPLEGRTAFESRFAVVKAQAEALAEVEKTVRIS